MRITLFSLVTFILVGFTACNSQNNASNAETSEQQGIYKVISPEDFKAGIAANAAQLQLIDVRTPGEVSAGAIEGAVNLDFRENGFKDKIASLDKNRPVYLYCASGGRSGKTSKMMETLGFKEVYDLEGGYSNWTR